MKRFTKLWQYRRYCRFPTGTVRFNCLAVLICLTVFSVLVLSFHATPAGAGLDTASRAGPQISIAPLPQAIPTGSDAPGAIAGLSIDELNRRIHTAIHGSRLALQLHVALLELGVQRMATFSDYTATFLKQEKVDGDELQPLQTCALKLRHEPFSVYMKWIEGGDEGREVLFVDGQHENQMLVRLGGAKRKLIKKPLPLDPAGSLALKESRHPITEMGLQQLSALILKYRKRDLGLKDGVRWQLLADQKFMDRECHCFVIEYNSREVEPTYRKSITYIDKELSLPVCVKNFGWPEEDLKSEASQLDDDTLIEFYGYTDVQFNQRLGDGDFDKATLRR